MEMGFDHRHWPQSERNVAARGDAARDAVTDSGIMSDWAGLRARFLAGHALRRIAMNLPQAPRAHAGSFDETAARQLGTFTNPERAVNPNALVNGKAQGGNQVDVAGASKPGDRG